jgi:hypothetical protein
VTAGRKGGGVRIKCNIQLGLIIARRSLTVPGTVESSILQKTIAAAVENWRGTAELNVRKSAVVYWSGIRL